MFGNISSIETLGLVDGPGIRVVVFLQGCPLRCLYCQNPETWNYNEIKNKYTPKQLITKILKYKSYFKNGGGVTFSGGEPLVQQEFLLECLKLCKENGIHTCIDTAGSVKINTMILDYVDLVILDIKSTLNNDYIALTGQNMDNLMLFIKNCEDKNIPLWIRQVIVPNYNDNEQNILKLANFVKKIKNIDKIELLPYSNLCKAKYCSLQIPYILENTSNMDQQKLLILQAKLMDLLIKSHFFT